MLGVGCCSDRCSETIGESFRLEISLLVQQEALNFHDFPEVDYSLELLITELLFANLPHWPFAPKPLQSLRPRSFHCFSCRCQVVIDPRISIDCISCAVCNPFPSLLGFGQQSLPLRPSLLQLWSPADFRLSRRQVFADIVNTLQERRAKWCTICAIESDWIRLNGWCAALSAKSCIVSNVNAIDQRQVLSIFIVFSTFNLSIHGVHGQYVGRTTSDDNMQTAGSLPEAGWAPAHQEVQAVQVVEVVQVVPKGSRGVLFPHTMIFCQSP